MRAAEVARSIALTATPSDAPALEGDEIKGLARRMLEQVDPVYGGFRGRTKFPVPVRWTFLLHAYRKWGDPTFAEALRKTLDAIDEGGIHDHVAGGFFRYATEPTWTIPHFEKMLYDNAELASLYFEAAVALGEPGYRDVALDTLEFLLRDMRAPGGAFGTSWDADSGGSEGAYYLWTHAELREVAGDSEGRALGEMLGVSQGGNLKVVTAWNGLAIAALTRGYRASGDARFLDAASQALETVWRTNRLSTGELARASADAKASERAVLDDYAALGAASLDLFEATSNVPYLERAVELAEQARKNFANPSGGWFLTSGTDQEPLGRRMILDDGPEASGNATMIFFLMRLGALTGRDALDEDARRALRAHAANIRRQPFDMAGWLDGALFERGPLYELVVAGSSESPGTRALLDVWKELCPSWTVGARVEGDGPTEAFATSMPTAAGKRDRRGTALAFVCVRGSCQAPTSDRARLRAALMAGWSR